MPETMFCYCCRVSHPLARMRLFQTRRGLRWRCIDSILAAGASPQERDQTGSEQTRWNREADRHRERFFPNPDNR